MVLQTLVLPSTAMRRSRILPLRRLLLFAATVACPLRTGLGQTDSVAGDTLRVTQEAEISPGSPRVAAEQFLSLTRAGEFVRASAWLEVADTLASDAPSLARQLKAVLDRHLWIDLERVSPLMVGDTADGLAHNLEQLGTIRGPDGVPVPIRLIRSGSGAEVPWRFTQQTVAAIPSLYGTLRDRWILEHLPAPLLRPGPLDLLWWQWLALPLVLLIATIIGAASSRLLRSGLTRLVKRSSSEWDDAVITRIGAPLTAALTLLVGLILIQFLALYPPAEAAAHRVIRVGFFVVIFWSLWRLVDIGRQVLAQTQWALDSASSRALLPLGARITKVIVLAVSAVAVFSMLGYPVASLLAGLGLGGLALALAAQKTVENLFGAFSIGVDQPFREGDFVKIEDFVGTVEAMGLRSSRFRTLDRTVITIPNGRLAEMRLESFTARDRLRLAMVVGLVYETTAAQMRDVLSGFEQILRSHPKIWPDAVVVRFREFAASSLDIEVMAWFQTADWSEFQLIRQEVLLQFMEVVERSGSGFAFPTQTVHLGADSVEALRSSPATTDGRVTQTATR